MSEARSLDLVERIETECPSRRSDAKLSYGQLLTILAIQRAIAPMRLRSQEQLRAWYECSGIHDLLPVDAAGLDPRRVDEALSSLRARDLDRLE